MPHCLDARALPLFRVAIERSDLAPAAIVATASTSGSRLNGDLEMTSTALLDDDPRELRVTLDGFALRAHLEASRQAEEDERRIKQFLSGLLDPDNP